MSELNITTRQVEGIIILDLSGSIALGETSAKLHEALRDLVNEGKRKILINLKNVSGIDSSGLGSLIAGYTTVEKSGGQLKLVNLTQRTIELMTITKLFTVFDIFEDEMTAIDGFAADEQAASVA